MGGNGVPEKRALFLLLTVLTFSGLMASAAGSYPATMRRQLEARRASSFLSPPPTVPHHPARPSFFALALSFLCSCFAHFFGNGAGGGLSVLVQGPRVFHVTNYGADPSGKLDATEAISRAVADAFSPTSSDRALMAGIADLGGAEVHLDGGSYLVSSPIRLPGGGNVKIHGGSLHASDDFPTDGYLIELRSPSPSTASQDYEFITLRDLLLDANYRGGGVAVVNSLRTTVDNLYVSHFATDGILVRGGHETYIRNSFLGQHITAGNDPGERNFSGTAINLSGNDNAVTDVSIFSGAVGVLVAGQANTLSNVHCYNKATGWGGTGIYLKLPGLTQTRIVNCYMDYTGIVAEDPVQLHISGTFFLGDSHVTLKSVSGVMRGVDIVDNMFAGSDKGVDIVQLEGEFATVEQVVVDRNSVRGMTMRSTVARGTAAGNGTTWAVDFSPVLVFKDRIDHVQYTMRRADGAVAFVGHAVKTVAGNRVVVESNSPVTASVDVSVHQGV